jgi:drug/metabolite transporter (DMT)-like permease
VRSTNLVPNPETRGLLFGLIAVVIFSVTLPATRAAVPEFGAAFVAVGRILIASAISGLALYFGKAGWPSLRDAKSLAIVTLGTTLGFPVLTSFAMTTATAGRAAIITGLLPLVTAIAGAWRNNERPSMGFWAAAVTGSLLVILAAFEKGSDLSLSASLLLLAAVGIGGIGYAEGGRLAKTLGGWQTIAWSVVFGLPFAVLALPMSVGDIDFSRISLTAWLSLFYVSIFSQFVGFIFWYRGLGIGGIAKVSQIQLIQIFFTFAFSALWLGEKISIHMLGYAAGVIACVWVGRRTYGVAARAAAKAGE